jgi:hypothetical protein
MCVQCNFQHRLDTLGKNQRRGGDEGCGSPRSHGPDSRDQPTDDCKPECSEYPVLLPPEAESVVVQSRPREMPVQMDNACKQENENAREHTAHKSDNSSQLYRGTTAQCGRIGRAENKTKGLRILRIALMTRIGPRSASIPFPTSPSHFDNGTPITFCCLMSA